MISARLDRALPQRICGLSVGVRIAQLGGEELLHEGLLFDVGEKVGYQMYRG